MPPTGSTFTDWQQVEKESRLLMDEDFSWSEPPQRRRRRITQEPIRARRSAVLEYEPDEYEFAGVTAPESYFDPDPRSVPDPYSDLEAYPDHGRYSDRGGLPASEHWDQPTQVHSHFDELMEQWNMAYGEPAERSLAERAFDLSDPGAQLTDENSRRTVVITGHGDDRYMPAPRRHPSADLRFHERSSFSPDRAGLWAVLLGLALLIGCIVH